MTRAVLSIGSNLGDRLAHLRSVVDGFGDRVVAVSPVYSTPPWGGVEQDDYLNAVVLVDDPELGCTDWLRRGQRLEQAADRVREVRWGARTLDVDVIWCAQRMHGELVPISSADPELTLPHPQAHRRAFVLIPWLDVEPDAVLELDGRAQAITDLLDELPAAERLGVQRTELTLSPAAEGSASCS
ncbi:2-amino-4-hydroxy-6-hydroxymethyldihydropteridine diphosphokinase [Nocardia colli]|uniref:2-amino-4-hydroxy-6-hydroxymethyldihydropteridine diphosphokinase n=1 Tax=Nocardia colli TaxID=2545717 RepID=A0A5N0EKH0_9NOCA|nr:2-amino-4-hydroxy-6-hydroxymethyldihydropteridine diphosphokinase [Nocardia colli]KAA8889752.1 2-amino-4-hydroxy-6-hydroxymethyldihydropteridine diphosphokinase [Nocardia colli]